MVALGSDSSAGREPSPELDERAANALRTVERLTELSRVDWLFADLYHERAESVLSEVCSRERFLGLGAEREQLARIASELEHSLSRGDWHRVQTLARDAHQLRGRVQRSARAMDVAASVYQVQPLVARPMPLSLAGIGTLPTSYLRDELASMVDTLRALADLDRAQADFYLRRAQHYATSALESGSDSPVRVAPEGLLSALRDAAGRQDFTQVEILATTAAEEHRDARGRVRASTPSESLEQRLGASFPPTAVDAARRLGFEARLLPAKPELNNYLSCTCSESAGMLESSVEPERRPVSACTCGHPCPPGVRPTLKDTLDLLIGHVFVSSACARYLPWFGAEHVLVETFSEEPPGSPGALLDQLGLPRRIGLSHVAVEYAVLEHGPRLCREIGLDPFEFKLVCVPFDVFLRLAPGLGWGGGPRWTHFDGYQVTRDLKLLGLVGGDVRYGGPDDLCSVGADYESDRLLLRLAIVRRERLAVRASPTTH